MVCFPLCSGFSLSCLSRAHHTLWHQIKLSLRFHALSVPPVRLSSAAPRPPPIEIPSTPTALGAGPWTPRGVASPTDTTPKPPNAAVDLYIPCPSSSSRPATPVRAGNIDLPQHVSPSGLSRIDQAPGCKFKYVFCFRTHTRARYVVLLNTHSLASRSIGGKV